jgi:hypothetical protein
MGLLGKETEENISKLVALLEWFKGFLQSHEVRIGGISIKIEPKERK